MASNLATIRVELIANAQKFKTNVDKASQSLTKVQKSTAKTTKGSQKLAKVFQNTAGSIAAVQGPLGPVAGRISSIGAMLGRVNPMMLAFTAAFIGAGLALVKFARAGAQAESQFLKLEALIKATGTAAQQTGTDIEAMARDIGIGTLASVQGARDAAGVLLTFKAIAGSTFEETLKLTQDLAAVGFGSMKTAALQLGKALEDPETGLSALRRVGVSFTEQQKEQIKVLAMTGRQMEAQAIIIQTLKDQVGGAGEGAAGGLTGAFDSLFETMNLFFERNAFGALVVSKTTGAVNSLTEALAGQVRTVEKLPDTEKELNKLREETRVGLIEEMALVSEMIRKKDSLGVLDAIEIANLTRLIEVKKFEIHLESKLLEDIKKKIKAIKEEPTVRNKAVEITMKHIRKTKRALEDEMNLSSAIGDKKKMVIEQEIKLRDTLISKLGDSKEALKAINELLEIERGEFEHNAEVMTKFREELAQVDQIATGVADEISKVGDTIVDAFLRGKAGALDFKNILRELIISIQKTIIQTLILDQVNKFVKSTIQGIFNPTNPVKGSFSAPNPHKAGGGTVQAGTPTMVGERGPELFVPNTGGVVKNNADTKQMVGSGGGINVTQNLNFAVGVTNTVRAEVMNMLPAIQQSTVNAVAEAKQRGGKFSKAFGS
jgi:replicative DNA helicase